MIVRSSCAISCSAILNKQVQSIHGGFSCSNSFFPRSQAGWSPCHSGRSFSISERAGSQFLAGRQNICPCDTSNVQMGYSLYGHDGHLKSFSFSSALISASMSASFIESNWFSLIKRRRMYKVFIKYCVFSLKFCDFSELCQFCCSAGFLPAIVYTH